MRRVKTMCDKSAGKQLDHAWGKRQTMADSAIAKKALTYLAAYLVGYAVTDFFLVVDEVSKSSIHLRRMVADEFRPPEGEGVGEESIRWESRQDAVKQSNEIPKILHFMVLGPEPAEYMNQAAEFHREYVKSTYPEFVMKIWRDEDADQLVEDQKDEGISKAWEAVKRTPPGLGKYAKMADFMRVLIMYAVGGIYLDVDMVPCGGLDDLVDEPGIVSFPFVLPGGREINGAGMSSPKKHILMKMALDSFVQKGDELTTLHNLAACGPNAMAEVVDRYIEGIFGLDSLSLNIPHFSNNESKNYMTTDLVRHENGWWSVADIRYRYGGLGIYHLHFGSWFYWNSHGESGEKHQRLPCIQHPEKVKPFLNWICENKRDVNFEQCGIVDQT